MNEPSNRRGDGKHPQDWHGENLYTGEPNAEEPTASGSTCLTYRGKGAGTKGKKASRVLEKVKEPIGEQEGVLMSVWV